ncbi:MAG: hypothetical protein E3K32_04465 [wastewater metagenome]|nr:hypothetical protein [Candidatus Loosdrechtia aerotolerans]
MKRIISVICMLLVAFALVIGAKNVSAQEESRDVLKNLESFQRSLAGWMQNFDALNTKFDALQKEVKESLTPVKDAAKEIKGLEGRYETILSRVVAMERSASVAEVSAAIASFGDTLNLLKKLLSELTKRVEDQEVKTAVLEKRYKEAEMPLEPIKKAIDDLSRSMTERFDSMTERFDEQARRLEAAEENVKTHIQASEGQLKQIVSLQEQIQKLETAGPVTVGTETVTAEAPRGEVTGEEAETEKVAEAAEVPEAVTVPVKEEHVPTPEEEGYTGIGEGFYIRDVQLLPFGSSSQIQGEIKNLSEYGRSIVLFTVKIYNTSDMLLFSQDFSVKGFEKDEVRTFNEIISGYTPLDIARYEIVPKERY